MTHYKKSKSDIMKFSFNLKDYNLEALYETAYSFLDKAYIHFDEKKKNKIEVFLNPKKSINQKRMEEMKNDFMNELLNYTVRVNLSKKNKKIRELIIGEALVSAIGIDSNNKDEDDIKYEDDPLGIAIPWEDKYGEVSNS